MRLQAGCSRGLSLAELISGMICLEWYKLLGLLLSLFVPVWGRGQNKLLRAQRPYITCPLTDLNFNTMHYLCLTCYFTALLAFRCLPLWSRTEPRDRSASVNSNREVPAVNAHSLSADKWDEQFYSMLAVCLVCLLIFFLWHEQISLFIANMSLRVSL